MSLEQVSRNREGCCDEDIQQQKMIEEEAPRMVALWGWGWVVSFILKKRYFYPALKHRKGRGEGTLVLSCEDPLSSSSDS